MPRYVTLEDNGPPEEFTAKDDEAAIRKMKRMSKQRMLDMEVFRSIGVCNVDWSDDSEDEEFNDPHNDCGHLETDR